MSTQICDLVGNESDDNEELNYDDFQSIVMDLSIPIHRRLSALTSCYEYDTHRAVECLSTLASQYQMSGVKSLETFLRGMCDVIGLPSFFRIEAAKALLEYEELEDCLDSDNEDKKLLQIENKAVRERNQIRKKIAAAGLEAVCVTMREIPTPCRVEAICLLMEHHEHKTTADRCFKLLVNDSTIECDFRYRCILDLENRGAQNMRNRVIDEFSDTEFVARVYKKFNTLIEKEFPKFTPSTSSIAFFDLLIHHIKYNQLLEIFRERFPSSPHIYEFYLYESQLSFMTVNTNYTSYRILAGQYLLQKFTPSSDTRVLIQETLLGFANDTELDYNLRADAADVLMQLGDDAAKALGQQVIMDLGRSEGEIATVFQNSQNVHTEEVEASVAEALEFFSGISLMKISEIPIEFPYVQKQVRNLLKKQKDARFKETQHSEVCEKICKYCGSGIMSTIKGEFSSQQCASSWARDERINLALGRIEMDRALYSRYNSTLVNILLKIWTYLVGHEHEEEMKKRLLEELEEMSGTCSSGFASRLINVISGFGEFSIRISWGDQIKANLFGRLNAAARRITDQESIFSKDPYLTDMVMLYLNEDHTACGENSQKALIMKELTKAVPSQQQIVKIYLHQSVTDGKTQTSADINQTRIQDCLTQLMESVLIEISIPSSLSATRQYFSLFFRSHLPFIREEMYAEFKEFMDDTEFDLYMRKAMVHYEGAM
jgi:hypothetical protein